MECRRAKPWAVVVVLAVLRAAVAGAAPAGDSPSSQDSVPASVQEVPQRPMTVRSGGLGVDDESSKNPFPIGRGEPFVVDPANVPQNHGPIAGFDGRPRSADRTDEYGSYDYDPAKLEEVAYDYRGDTIDRKDVRPEPGSARPNDIVKPVNKPPQSSSNSNNNNKLQTPTDIYQFLNLPKQYSSSDFKFPLVSGSYANTKVQGSGSSSSSLSNHKMPEASTTTAATTTGSWYNPTTVKPTTTTTAARPTTTTTAARPTTTTTTAAPSQEYEEYDYNDYSYHPQEPALSPSAATTTASATTTSTTTTTSAPPPAVYHRNSSSFVTPEPTATVTAAAATTTATRSIAAAEATSPHQSSTAENLHRVQYSPATKTTTTTTTSRPEIDSKLDGTSFADYDTIKPSDDKAHQHYGQSFRPLPGNYQFDEKTYPLVTNSKVPMTFTAHVSSGISLNQKDLHRPTQASAPSESVVHSSRPPQPEIQDSSSSPAAFDGNARLQQQSSGVGSGKPYAMITDAANPLEPLSSTTYSKPKPSRPAAVVDQFETVYHKVRPDAAGYNGPAQQFSSAAQNRPVLNQPPAAVQVNRPYQPEPPATKTPLQPTRKPAANPGEGRPAPMQQPYPAQPGSAKAYVKNQPPQHVPPTQSAVDTSKFKPPKHVINHFIKTLPDEDNKSYALQTSFSIGMDGERTGAETRPGQGVGQVLTVNDGSSEVAVAEQPIPSKPSSTTSVPLMVPPSRLAAKPLQQQYPRPPWEEHIPKQPAYYPQQLSPKRDGPPPPPPQRTGLPNILPQFRPNAKVDAAPMAPQSHSATIERVQIPTDRLRPPPPPPPSQLLPKPQFLKMDRRDENADEEMLDVPEKETRILQTAGPQPAKVTTLQMIQHHGAPAKTTRENGAAAVRDGPVHVVYAAVGSGSPKGPVERPAADDSAIPDAKDRSDVPVLKTKTTAVVGKPAKTGDFPYQIVKPGGAQPPPLEYHAYGPTTKLDTGGPNGGGQDLRVPNLQDYAPVGGTRGDSSVVVPPAAQQKPIAATLKTTTTDDSHRPEESQRGKPQLQNFQPPFHASMKLPENTNGWSVVRKSPVDNPSDRMDETGDAAAPSTEKFDPDSFKPHLVGGFVPISSLPDEGKEKNSADHSERA